MRRLLLVCLVLMFIVPITAQEDETETFNRLPDILAQVPDTPAARQWFTFADYQAMTLARPGALQPPNYEAIESDLAPYAQWWRAFLGISSGISFDFAPIWWDDGDIYHGFTFFDMDASVEYGSPPEAIQMLIANYNVADVIAAHEEREYTVSEEENYTLLCSSDGCDAGQQVNIESRLQGYSFGGSLGREQPVMITNEDTVLSSPYLPSVEAHIDLLSGDSTSLADDANYQAIATAAGHDVSAVIQGYILPVSVIATTDDIIDMMLGSDAPEEQRQAFAEQLGLSDAENLLPAYSVFGIIDAATDTEQVARVLLPYENEDDAQFAADELINRLETMSSLMVRRPFDDILEDRGATYQSYVTEDETMGRFVTVIEFRAPLPTALDNDEGLANASSTIYRILPQMVFAGDTAWLAPNLGADND